MALLSYLLTKGPSIYYVITCKGVSLLDKVVEIQENVLTVCRFKTNVWENSKFHNFLLEVQNNMYQVI